MCNVQFSFLYSISNIPYPMVLSNYTFLIYRIRLCNQLIMPGLYFSNQCTCLVKIQVLEESLPFFCYGLSSNKSLPQKYPQQSAIILGVSF